MNAVHAAARERQQSEIELLIDELRSIRDEMIANADALRPALDRTHASHRASAVNLAHYLALRCRDLRPLQRRLANLGLSSLGRSESHTLANIDALLEVLHRLAGRPWVPPAGAMPDVDLGRGQRLLTEHTKALLGPADPARDVRIMVTMPSEAAHDYPLVRELLRQGMQCMRINCAHDDAAAWLKMIRHLQRARRALGRDCRVVMDLAGPKLRTGPVEAGPAVQCVRPHRDVYGRVVAAARVWLSSDSDAPPPAPADAVCPVPAAWLAALRVGEKLHFRDAREARREFEITDLADGGVWAQADKTCYLVPGTVLRRRQGVGKAARSCRLGDWPGREGVLVLQQGERLHVTRDLRPGRAATRSSTGRLLQPASIGCTIPEVFDDARVGESIWFDDGKIGAVIEAIDPRKLHVRITQAVAGGAKLRAGKGINLPESQLRLGALSEQDLEDLRFAAAHADVVELSFANRVEDVERLQEELQRLDSEHLGIVLKIETRRGFASLPEMLLAAMRWPSCGIMIARGDLAVECGFERLAEVQEEILWICEAAHVPVIWATQVLETLAKHGMPSRAEITDAAMGHRAECVMLNKGPHLLSAMRVLDDILRRMQAHQQKKQAMLRELHLAHLLPNEPAATIKVHRQLATEAGPAPKPP